VASVGAVAQALAWHPCPQDDAFISFRYAASLLHGNGLTYNPGEWVEGFTNLLWTLILALMMALGLDPVLTAALLGALSFGGVVIVAARLGARVAGPVCAAVAALLVALDLQAGLEAVEGLETTFYALLIGAGAALALAEAKAERAHWGSSVVFAAAVLTRPEAPMHVALLHLGLLLSSSSPKARLRASLQAAVPLLLVLGGLTAWRMATYGVPLPNTFYAKTGGFAVGRGLRYLLGHALDHPALWLLVLLRPLLRRPSAATLPLGLLAVGHLAYVVAVGGDFKPTGRFVLPVQVALVVLAGETAAILWQSAARAPATRRFGLGVMAVAMVALIAGLVRSLPVVSGWADYRLEDYKARRTVGEYLGRSFPPDTLIAIHSAGCIPFYSGLPAIDMWGLADAHIARAPVRDAGLGMAGHERSDPEYVFSRNPALYLPEGDVFTLMPHDLVPGPDFPADFTERYRSVSIPVEGRVLNLWVRKGFIDAMNAGRTGP
jgi:arabinofuranosyltransferase